MDSWCGDAVLPRHVDPARAAALPTNREGVLNLDENGDRLSVPGPRPEHPALQALHGLFIEGGEQRLNDADVPDRPIGVHDALEFEAALDTSQHRVGGITRRPLVNGNRRGDTGVT